MCTANFGSNENSDFGIALENHHYIGHFQVKLLIQSGVCLSNIHWLTPVKGCPLAKLVIRTGGREPAGNQCGSSH